MNDAQKSKLVPGNLYSHQGQLIILVKILWIHKINLALHKRPFLSLLILEKSGSLQERIDFEDKFEEIK